MSLSCYRRKIKYVAPITIMREFFRDSNQKSLIKSLSKTRYNSSITKQERMNVNTNFTIDKFTKILNSQTSREGSLQPLHEKRYFQNKTTSQGISRTSENQSRKITIKESTAIKLNNIIIRRSTPQKTSLKYRGRFGAQKTRTQVNWRVNSYALNQNKNKKQRTLFLLNKNQLEQPTHQNYSKKLNIILGRRSEKQNALNIV